MPLLAPLLAALLLQQSAASPAPNPAQGTGELRGRLVESLNGQPIGGVTVRLSSTKTPPAPPKSTSSDDAGRFVFTSLPAGSYTLSVTRNGVVTTMFGAPDERRVTAVVSDGAATDVGDLRVPTGVPITGQILDEHGNPLKGAAVSAWRLRYLTPGERRLESAGQATTSETGDYRIAGLRPGTYYIDAKMSEAIAPTFFPATANAASAAPVTVTATVGASASIRLLATPLARVSGKIVNARGEPSPAFYVILAPVRDDGAQVSSLNLTSDVDADGKFAVNKVPPGSYDVQVISKARAEAIGASGRSAVGIEAADESGAKRVIVDGADIDDVFIRAQTPTVISGKVLLDGEPIPAAAAAQLTISTSQNAGPSGMSAVLNSSFGTLNADGTFVMLAVPGGRLIRARGLPPGAVFKRVLVRGADVTDDGFDVASSPISDVVVELTTRPGVVSGRVADEKAAPIGGASVIVYSTDPSRWRLVQTRVVVSGRTKADGTFSFAGLPAGSYYIVSVPELVDGEWAEPANLERLRAIAQTFKLGDGETKELTLILKK